MSDRNPDFSPSRQERGEVDTAAPFESVKAAVSMFGGQPKYSEKLSMKETELRQTLEELAKVKEELISAEQLLTKTSHELEQAKLLLHELSKKHNATESSEGAEVISEEQMLSDMQEEVVHVMSEIEFLVANERYMKLRTEVENSKRELEDLKQKLLTSLNEKELAAKQVEEASSAAEVDVKRVEELTAKIASAKESLLKVNLACSEANKEKDRLLAQTEAERNTQVEVSNIELAMPKEPDAETTSDLESLRAELAAAKEAEADATRAAEAALSILNQAKSDLERTRMSEEAARSSLVSLHGEVEEIQLNLKKGLEDGVSLKAELERIEKELEMTRKQVLDLREREANATAATISLTAELARMKADLMAAVAAETKAKEAISGLSQAFEQVTAEADEAFLESESMREEAQKAKADTEEAKVLMHAAESKLQSALKEAEGAKEAESVALGRIKALSEKTSAARASEVDASGKIIISRDEYNALQRKMQEAHELATIRVAAALAQVEAIKASELEIQQKLETADDEIQNMKRITHQAVQRSEMAQAAKSAVEGELKRLREREQKIMEIEAGVAQQMQRDTDWSISFDQSSSVDQSHSQISQFETRSKALNMRTPETGESKTKERISILKKKKSFLPLLGAFLVRNKSHLMTNSLPSGH